MSVALRPARLDDADALRAWRNDPVTVAASDGHTVEPEEHTSWLASVLADPARRLWIVEADGEPVGQVRLDQLDDGREEISVALAPAARGRRLGSAAIRAGTAQASNVVVARVRVDNAASLRAFAAASYREVERDGEWVWLTCTSA